MVEDQNRDIVDILVHFDDIIDCTEILDDYAEERDTLADYD